MKKKLVIILSLVIAIVLCVPTIPVMADNSEVLGFYTAESVNGFFIGDFNGYPLSDGASNFYKVNNSFVTSEMIDSFNNIDLSTVTDPNYCSFLCKSGTTLYYFVFQFGGNNNILFYNNYTFLFFTPNLDDNQQIYFRSYTYSNGTWSSPSTLTASTVNGYDNKTYRYYQFPPSSGSQDLSLLYCNNMFCCDINEYAAFGGTLNGFDRFVSMYNQIYNLNNENGFTNYCPSNLPYWNGEEVINPDSVIQESNLNHMYFNSCQLGFCEPYGVTNFSNFGGAYFYAKYSVDEWVRNHITDYSLYFYATAYVDSRQYSGNVEVRLDNDGCITIPFSDIFSTDGGVVSEGFLAYISPNLVEQSFYDTSLYSVNKEQVQSFINQRNLSSQDDWDIFWQDMYNLNNGQPVGNPGFGAIGYLSNNFSALLNGTISPSIINAINNHTNFKIHVNCYLKDNSGNVSGNVGKMFDLKVGNNFSTNNEGLTNNDPYIETDLPSDYVPSIIPENNGYSLSDIGNNNQIVNFSTPDQIKLFIDNGFQQFLTWYETSADTAYASNRFWSSMGIFENNPATELYSEYFGFLPDDFKTLIFSCAGIGIVGGAYCILRRRLH